jgi:hypothetical protein
MVECRAAYHSLVFALTSERARNALDIEFAISIDIWYIVNASEVAFTEPIDDSEPEMREVGLASLIFVAQGSVCGRIKLLDLFKHRGDDVATALSQFLGRSVGKPIPNLSFKCVKLNVQ